MKKEVIKCHECHWYRQQKDPQIGTFYVCYKQILPCPQYHDYCSRAQKHLHGLPTSNTKEDALIW